MIRLDDNSFLVESPSELPSPPNDLRRVYVDHETRSGDPKRGGNRPFQGDQIACTAVTWDDCPRAYCVPRLDRHGQPTALYGTYAQWLSDWIGKPHTAWVNHNVKFDAHFSQRAGAVFGCELHDTMVAAKILDSDRTSKGGYALDVLATQWLDFVPKHYGRVESWLRGAGTKDYGEVPTDVLGAYACEDVLVNRRLERYVEARMPDECLEILGIERRLTEVLYDMEQEGLRVDPSELALKQLLVTREMDTLEGAMHDEVGWKFNPLSSTQMREVVCGTFGLPPIAFTETRNEDEDWAYDYNPSFDVEALTKYSSLPEVVTSKRLRTFFAALRMYKKLAQFRSLFLVPYSELCDEANVLHPWFNQIVRTGRMSASSPNAQQLSEMAKELIHPAPGSALMRFDYSQIEFRLIVHYMNDEKAIKAYNEDPTTDFHTFVAELCGISRSPAKNVNFAIAFGGGKKRVLSMLETNPDLIATILAEARASGTSEGLSARYKSACTKRANDVYRTYHATFPGVRALSNACSNLVESRGYVRTAYKRRRHLPAHLGYRGMNSVIQGTAADIMKERTVACSPRFNRVVRELGLKPVAVVHDEIVWHGPEDVIMRDDRAADVIRRVLEAPSQPFRVPIRVEGGRSTKHWAEASSKASAIAFDRSHE